LLETEQKMNWKTITAAAVVSASIAAPAFAQRVDLYYGGGAPYQRAPQTSYRSYDVLPGSYAPRNNDEWQNQGNFGFSGRDPLRVGGESPNPNPPGS
jgi:hypothetical protein